MHWGFVVLSLALCACKGDALRPSLRGAAKSLGQVVEGSGGAQRPPRALTGYLENRPEEIKGE
jgi:hypothetical protein